MWTESHETRVRLRARSVAHLSPVKRFLCALCIVAVVLLPETSASAGETENPADAIAISVRTARRLGLRVGDVIEVGADPVLAHPRRVRVAAIWAGPEHPADVARGDAQLRLHLPVLEELLDRRDVVDRVVIRLRDRADPRVAARTRDDLRNLGLGFDVYTADDLVERTSQTFVVIARFQRAIALITMFATGIFLVTLMALRLTEMRREVGALRLMGLSRRTIAATVMLVAALVSAAGCGAGMLLGAVMVWGINAYYQPLFGTSLRFAVLERSTVVFSATVALILGLAAGAAVTARILRQSPLEQVSR